MPARIPDDERERIIAEFATGKSRNQIAREFSRSASVITKIAQEADHDFDQSQTKKAVTVKQTYDRNRRIDLLDAGLAKNQEILPSITKPYEMQQWWMGVAVGMDKRRQEDASDDKRVGKIRQYLEFEMSKPDDVAAIEPETEAEYP